MTAPVPAWRRNIALAAVIVTGVALVAVLQLAAVLARILRGYGGSDDLMAIADATREEDIDALVEAWRKEQQR